MPRFVYFENKVCSVCEHLSFLMLNLSILQLFLKICLYTLTTKRKTCIIYLLTGPGADRKIS